MQVIDAVQEHTPLLLTRPYDLLCHLAFTTYPSLPPSSTPHLACVLRLMVEGLREQVKVRVRAVPTCRYSVLRGRACEFTPFYTLL